MIFFVFLFTSLLISSSSQMQNTVLIHHQIIVVLKIHARRQVHHLVLIIVIILVRRVRIVGVLWARGQLAIATEWAASWSRQCSLIRWLYGDDEIWAVRDHHVGHLRGKNDGERWRDFHKKSMIQAINPFDYMFTWSSVFPCTSIPFTSSTSSFTASKPVDSARPPGTRRDMKMPGCFSMPFGVTFTDVPSRM